MTPSPELLRRIVAEGRRISEDIKDTTSATITEDQMEEFYRFWRVNALTVLSALESCALSPQQADLQVIENAIAERSKRFRTFDDRDEHSRYMALALAGEVGELLNIVKKHWRGDTPSVNGKALLDEASDIFIYWTLFCHVHGWGIWRVIEHANAKAERKILALEAERAKSTPPSEPKT